MTGDKIKALRLEKKYTQEDLALKLGISKSTVGMYEQNRRMPDLMTIKAISRIFNVTTDYLVENIDSRSDSHNVFRFTDFEKKIILAYRVADDVDQIIVNRALNLSRNQKSVDLKIASGK